MKPYYQEPNAVLYQGHALGVLKGLPSESVDCAITSPPYWGLRTYKTEPQIWGDNNCEHKFIQYDRPNGGGHPSKSAQVGATKVDAQRIYDYKAAFCLKCNAWRGELGLEPTIELYISHLVLIFQEVKRVLKKIGTCWVNIDDSYTSTAQGTMNAPSTKIHSGQASVERANYRPFTGLSPKSLCLIPQRFAIAMVGEGWILRNDIVWAKPNPMPESVKDRFTGSWEHLFFFAKNKRYWFEQQFEKADYDGRHQTIAVECNKQTEDNPMASREHERWPVMIDGVRGRNKRDVWEITTQPYPEAHFAVYPEKLVETPILAGCPAAICKKCGKARAKIYQKGFTDHGGKTDSSYSPKTTAGRLALLRQASREQGVEYTNDKEVIGYSNCGCNDGFEAGVVMDIFAGSGTTGAVAKRLGRKYIGIELSEEYCKLHVRRLQAVPLAMGLI